MSTLNQYINFSVVLDKSTSNSTITIKDTSSFPEGVSSLVSVNIAITQPDAFSDKGTASDIIWDSDNNKFTTCTRTLRVSSCDNTFQNGNYKIVYTVTAEGYDTSIVTRIFTLNHCTPTIEIKDDFDVFTPSLKLQDISDYSQPGFDVLLVSRNWVSLVDNILGEKTEITGSSEIFDLQYNSKYYDANYNTTLQSTITWIGEGGLSWLSLIDNTLGWLNNYAHNQPTIKDILAGLSNLKLSIDQNNYCACSGLSNKDYPCASSTYVKAEAIYNQFINRGKNEMFITPDRLDTYVDLLQKIYTGCGKLNFPLLGQEITPYDFSNTYSDDSTQTIDLTPIWNMLNPQVLMTEEINISKEVGDDLLISVAVSGGTPLTLQWYKDNVAIDGQTSSVLYIPTLAIADSGEYILKATNSRGTDSETIFTLNVAIACIPPVITIQPTNKTIIEGNSTSFTVAATGTNLKYQWYKNGVAITGETDTTLNISTSAIADSGTVYYVIVSNGCGTATSDNATLTVNSSCVAPTISTQPSLGTSNVGDNPILSVVANGTNLTYQWYKNGSAITGATSNSYTIGTITNDMVGDKYYVIITNGCGTVTSNTVTVSVLAVLQYAFLDSIPTDLDTVSYSSVSFDPSATSVAFPAPLIDNKFVLFRYPSYLPLFTSWVVNSNNYGTFTNDSVFKDLQVIGTYNVGQTRLGYFVTDSSNDKITLSR